MAEMKVLSDVKALDGKIGVLSGLKTTNKTSTVAAINENTEQINVLNIERGYLQPNEPTGNDFNQATQNGKYFSGDAINSPIDNLNWLVDVTAINMSYLWQIATCISPYNANGGRTFKRFCANGIWQPWEEIATTTKTEIDVPFVSGYTSNTLNRYASKIIKNVSLNKVDIYGSVKREDGGDFETGVDYMVVDIPSGYKNKFNCQSGASASELSGLSIGSARVAIFDGCVYVMPFVRCKCIFFTTNYEVI